MTAEEIREYCLEKNAVTESLPFDEDTLVFKVEGKMFLLLDLVSQPPSFNVKCEPEKALILREKYTSVGPGYHMNKVHWNTVSCDGSVPKKLILSWIDDSYWLIVKGLPKKLREKHIKPQ
ncbi:MAG: MmcQ/YjbR family DNA-binding protein [Bacteroidetes bacterium]|jgi:predicted DNA-binding protein (MmcQ/YjbR family)|nr:MmcQ/YjbR family DNA-binding protein [Bacteroidota bacterium]